MNMNKESALVVFSGGQDSTTCLFWAKRNFKKVYALSFLYGQKHEKEVELAREIARKAEVEFDVMDVSFIGSLGHNSLTDTSMVMDQEKPADSYRKDNNLIHGFQYDLNTHHDKQFPPRNDTSESNREENQRVCRLTCKGRQNGTCREMPSPAGHFHLTHHIRIEK